MIKEIGKDELRQVLDLVNKVFSEFVAVDYSEQGRKTFSDYLQSKYDEVSADLLSGNKKIWGYYEDKKIVGVIATRNVSHISLMFVDKEYHKRGIAKQLFSAALKEIKAHSEADVITVNSSPYAIAVYERLGFVRTDEMQERDRILFIPMECRI